METGASSHHKRISADSRQAGIRSVDSETKQARRDDRLAVKSLIGASKALSLQPSGHVLVEVVAKEYEILRSELMMDKLVFALRKNIDDLLRQRSLYGVPIRWFYVPTLPIGRFSGKCLSMDFACNDHYFQNAFDKLGLNIKIVTVQNDCVSTLLSGVHSLSVRNSGSQVVDCSIGVVSTRSGANIAFLETDQDFLDSCTADRRLLLKSPRGAGYCVVVNSEIGMNGGHNGELDDFINSVDKKVLESYPQKKLRWECLASGCWYFQHLKSSITMLKSLGALSENFPVDVTNDNCFELFKICDTNKYKSKVNPEFTAQLQSVLDPSHKWLVLESDARILKAICRAIVSRSAGALAAGIMAIAQRIYGKALPDLLAVANSGALFNLGGLRSALTREMEDLIGRTTSTVCKFELVRSDVAFGCAVSAISVGKSQLRNAQLSA